MTLGHIFIPFGHPEEMFDFLKRPDLFYPLVPLQQVLYSQPDYVGSIQPEPLGNSRESPVYSSGILTVSCIRSPHSSLIALQSDGTHFTNAIHMSS